MKTKIKANNQAPCQNEQHEPMVSFDHKVASMLSRGNISLQAGNFETAEEIDVRRNAVRTFNF